MDRPEQSTRALAHWGAGLLAAAAGAAAATATLVLVLGDRPAWLIPAVWAAAAALVLAALWPFAFLRLYVAVVLLIPISAGLQVSPDLPVIFVSRVVLGVGLAGAVVRQAWIARPRAPRNPLWLPVLLILLGGAVSVPTSVEPRQSLYRLAAMAVEWGGFVWLCWQALAAAGPGAGRRLLGWTLLVVLAAGLLGLVEAGTGFNLNQVLTTGYNPTPYYFEELSRVGLPRIRSTFSHPIEWGGTMALLFPVVFALWSKARRMAGWYYGALAALFLVNLALTASLGPLLALGLSVAALAALGPGRRLFLAVGGTAGLVLAVSSLVGPLQGYVKGILLDRFEIGTSSFATLAGRVAILLAAWHSFLKYPLLGSGLDTWFVIYPRAVFQGVSNATGGAGNENLYAQVLVETGLVGLVLFLGALLLLVLRVAQLWRRDPDPASRAVLAGLLAGMAGFYGLNLTANVWAAGGNQPATVLWLLLVTCVFDAQARAGRDGLSGRPDHWSE